jgi:hypothetical protein
MAMVSANENIIVISTCTYFGIQTQNINLYCIIYRFASIAVFYLTGYYALKSKKCLQIHVINT